MRYHRDHPEYNPLPDTTVEYYRRSMQLSADLLSAIGQHVLKIPGSHLTDFLDASDVPVSSSIFRYFRYYELKNRSDACAIHTDIGLLTLIPVSNNPSLEIQDPATQEWKNIEETLEQGDLMVLVGEVRVQKVFKIFKG